MADPTLSDVLDAIAALRAEMVTKADIAEWLGADDQGPEESGPDESELATEDPLYEEAVRVVRETKRCSTSWLQRKVGLAYSRAERIVAEMERRGIVAAAHPNGDHAVLDSP